MKNSEKVFKASEYNILEEPALQFICLCPFLIGVTSRSKFFPSRVDPKL